MPLCQQAACATVKAMRRTGLIAGVGAALLLVSVPKSGAQERQLPADQRAFQAAMAQADPAQRLTALRAFSVEYGDSKYFDEVQEAALKLLLHSFPTRSAEIRDQVGVNIANADKGYDRLVEQAREADLLADAGVLLPLAQHLAEEAVHGLTEAAYLRGMARMFGELQSEMPTPEELHGGYLEARAAAVLSLAHVYLRQGKLAPAGLLLAEAAKLQPRSAQLHALQGALASRAHDDTRALAELQTASVLGEVSSDDRAMLERLFREQHPEQAASPDELEKQLDRRWSELNPAIEPGLRPATPPAAHTVLLELFTGASCMPCVGADLAAEALFTSYGAADVALLEWDEHVPRPDALANPASVARAEVLGVGNTPTFFLDGKRMAVFGGTRNEATAIRTALGRLVDVQGARTSGFVLHLAATLDHAGYLRIPIRVESAQAEPLQTQTAAENAPWPGDSIAVAAADREQALQPPAPVLNYVLVEDHVRYSGENGVRFHRMVVRAIGSPPAWGDPLHPGRHESFEGGFDLNAVRQADLQYLQRFQKENDRFGPVQLLSTEVSLRPTELGVVAFVQDTRTHRVLQAAYAPVESVK